jgi:hypothetical protein
MIHREKASLTFHLSRKPPSGSSIQSPYYPNGQPMHRPRYTLLTDTSMRGKVLQRILLTF